VGVFIQPKAPLLVCLALLGASAGQPANVDELIEQNHFKRAQAIVDARLHTDASDAQAHAWLCKIRISFGDPEGAIAAGERAAALAPSNATYHAWLAEACAHTAEKSSVWRGLFYVHRMKRELAAALALDPRNIDALLVEMMFNWNAPAFAGGDRARAVRIAGQIVAIDPAWGYLAHARLLQDQDADAETEQWLLKAVEAAPNFYRARLSLARFYGCTARIKHYDLAERAALDALNLDPAASGAYEVLARVYAATRRRSELESLLARAEKAVPDDLGSYESAAVALVETGQDFPRAERYLNRYLSQPPEGRQPSHAEAHLTLATLYSKEGRKADAIHQLEAALRLEPDLQPARTELKRLQQS